MRPVKPAKLSFMVEKEDREQLDKIAKSKNVYTSELLREALKDYLAKNGK
jgi:predicted transcriptional regulator